MRTIHGAVFLSLDGVMQAPGGPTEDPTGGFTHGGWMFGFADEEVGAAIGAYFDGPYGLLLGRRTYDIFASHWPYVDPAKAPLADAFNAAEKQVLTRGGATLDWANSHALADLDAVAALKAGDGPDLLIQGSSTLYPPLLARGLLDRLTLYTFPVVLGSGKRLFGEGTPPGALTMTDHRVTGGGTVIATYQPGGAITPGSFGLQDPNPREQARQAAMAAGRW